jgi:L-ascorbate 6-phosphate lactonase
MCDEFVQNDPFDRTTPVRMLVPKLMESGAYMRSIREFEVPQRALAVWFLGQNGFLLKDEAGLLTGIDLYLTNSCAGLATDLPFRTDRQLPIFIEPEDLDLDVFVTTHSHDDHADPETLRRMSRDGVLFAGPWDSVQRYLACGISLAACRLIHPGETVDLGKGVTMQATFALPTDSTDLNHTGVLLRFGSGVTFYNTGDTAWAEHLSSLLPSDVDICAICINGGYHNLAPADAAAIVQQIRPKVVLPCHYDMMVNNTGSPAMFRVELERIRSVAEFVQLPYYKPWIYKRQ